MGKINKQINPDPVEQNGSEVNKIDQILQAVKKDSRNKWVETVSTILLSLATISSAWCVYESSQWNGEQYFRIEDESNADRDRMQKEMEAVQRKTFDAEFIFRYAEAVSINNEQMVKFLFDRRIRINLFIDFPPHLKKAAMAWRQLDPLNNPDAPASPMLMKEYVVPELEEIEKFAEQAKKFKLAANESDNRADNYMFLSLVLSTVLFFCGLSGIMDSYLNQVILIILAGIIYGVVVYFMLSFPVII